MSNKGETKPKRASKSKATASDAAVNKGLGDVVKKALDKLGIGIIFDGCQGCKDRQAYLNEKFPNLKAFKMNANQANIWVNIKPHIKKDSISGSVNRSMAELFNNVFNPSPRVEPVTCSSCWGEIENRAKKLETAYQNYLNG
jgi:hypothetical protein